MHLFNNFYTFWATLITANILMYLFNIAISYSWSKFYNHKTVELTKHDIYNSITVLIINVLAAIPEYLLFSNNKISFTSNTSFILDFITLFIFFYIAMFCLHLISHYVWPFKKFHNKHHSHEYFNIVSLYVMEPIEALLFGILLTLCAFFLQLNIYSFLSFLFLNWVLEVIGHLNTKSTKQPILFGNHVFYKAHHEYGNKNFGFYTVIWDKLFGTFLNSNK